MVGINFNKERAQYFLDCIAQGKPIEPEGPGWSASDMLFLAGALHFACMSHGPWQYIKTGMSKMNDEQREAVERDFYGDLLAAIEYAGHLCMLVKDEQFDEQFAPNVLASVQARAGEKTKIQILEGRKKAD